jgi:anion-transporting  ArsA/GET3 family ATPase
MPIEDIAITPQARPEKVFVPLRRIRGDGGTLETLATAFNVGKQAAEGIVEIAEREEATRVAGAIVDPTITDEALDAYADDARFKMTKVKIENRRGQIAFDKQRKEMDRELAKMSDPAQVRAALRSWKVQALGQGQSEAAQAGYMEAFAGYADQRIQRAHVEREQKLIAQDSAAVGVTMTDAFENHPEEWGSRFKELFQENELFQDTKRIVQEVTTVATNAVLTDPEYADEAIDRLEDMLDQVDSQGNALIKDPEERRIVTAARRRILSAQAKLDVDAQSAADIARNAAHEKAKDDIVDSLLKGKSLTPRQTETYFNTADDAFKAASALDQLRKRDLEDLHAPTASDTDDAVIRAGILSGTIGMEEILSYPGDGDQKEGWLRLFAQHRKGETVRKSEEYYAIIAANAFARFAAALPPQFTGLEAQQARAKVLNAERKRLVEEARKADEFYKKKNLDVPARHLEFQAHMDAFVRMAPHIIAPDDLFHGSAR